MLTLRAAKEFAAALRTTGKYPDLATRYENLAAQITANVRNNSKWLMNFAMHSAADAINANFTTPEENDILFARFFNDSVQICSLSSFNMFWVLQALGKMGKLDQAKAAIELCWGGQIKLGGTTFWEVYNWDWNTMIGINWFIYTYTSNNFFSFWM